MTQALVVDDEPAICRCFEALFADLDCSVTVTASAEEGLSLTRSRDFDVIVLDVRLPGMDGVSALPQFRECTDAPIIVITAHGTLSTAVSVVQEGAFEYLPKPFDLEQVTRVLQRALAHSGTHRVDSFQGGRNDQDAVGLVGNSLPMQQLFRQIALAAQHDAPVLITGESGTGKELVARAIHSHSSRRSQNLVPVHLASLSEALMERELFGHTAGAYTGADESQEGLMTRADQGTLFLDEIGETPMAVQVKLLRTIETGEFYPVGSARNTTSDFRLIAATNRSLDFLRSADSFRADLFYRLSTIHIHVPPLRDRREDIPALADFFLNQASKNGRRCFSSEATAVLMQRLYPGNVRELKNVVLRAAAESAEQSIGVDAVTIDDVRESTGADAETNFRHAVRHWAEHAVQSETASPLSAASEIVETELIEAALKHCEGNRSAAARLLGIHRETLREKLARSRHD